MSLLRVEEMGGWKLVNGPLTGEKVPDLFDQIPQVIVGVLNVLLGGHSFVQRCLSFDLGLLRLALDLHHLRKSTPMETKKSP